MDALVLLILDSRVQFLLWLVIVAVIMVGVLIWIEFRLKQVRKRKMAEAVEELAIGNIWQFLKYDKTPREKLDFIDKTAKVYFVKTYGVSPSSDYSVLIREFEKGRRDDEVAFCRVMFATYHSDKKLSEEKVIAIGKLLAVLIKIRDEQIEVSASSFFIDKIYQFIERRKMVRDEKARELKVAQDGICGIEREKIIQKIGWYGMNAKKWMYKVISKLGSLFRVSKFWKNEISAEVNVVGENVEVAEKESDENIRKKFFDGIKVYREKGDVLITRDNVFNYNRRDCANLQRTRREFPQKQTDDSNRLSDSVEIKREGIAERIVRNEKNRLNQVGISIG